MRPTRTSTDSSGSMSSLPECEPLCCFGERLYFTTFPGTPPSPYVLNSNKYTFKPLIRHNNPRSAPPSPDADAAYYYFTIDHNLVYLSFFKDWGPLNLAMVYKACLLIHELLEDEGLKDHRLVLYASDDPRRKANAALLMALYVMIVQKRAPWEAFNPIAELEFMPFRDAGRGASDFNLSIQDCLWGMWKAMQNGLCDMNEFNVEDYEFYEKVENGDWNWITPSFIAFASPVEPAWTKRVVEGEGKPGSSPLCASTSSSSSTSALQRKLPRPFQNCLDYFENRDVKLVVRLNNTLYDKTHFIDRGIRHEELYFDDGTNPTDEIVRKFINMSDEVIEAGGAVAVHCKAGLGRTGTLIGAYLIWKYGFTAHEAIAFMRIVRPGSVVGPQQQYMYVKQLEWTKWAAVDEMRRAEAQAAAAIAAASVVTPATPPAEAEDDDPMDSILEPTNNVVTAVVVMPTTPVRSSRVPPVTPSRHVGAATAKAGQISPPGQPRKTPVAKRTADVAAVDETDDEDEEDEINALPVLKPAVTRSRAKSQSQVNTTTATRAGTKRVPPASDQRPTRVTRSAAANAAANAVGRKPANVANSRGAAGSGPSPNKIPRLAQQTAQAQASPTRSTTSMSTRTRQAGVVPSRLPTLIVNNRRGAAGNTPATTVLTSDTVITVSTKGGKPIVVDENAAVGNADANANEKKAEANAWMKKDNAVAVVVPGSKSTRPGLRSVRRRRSSFSAADVVA